MRPHTGPRDSNGDGCEPRSREPWNLFSHRSENLGAEGLAQLSSGAGPVCGDG